MEDQMIEARNLRFRYDRRKELFRGLDLNFEPGTIYGLLGKNGAGKTTLLKIMVGLLFPKAGEALIAGEAAERRDPTVLARVYFLPEEQFAPPISSLTYGKQYGAFYPNYDAAKFESLLAQFEVEPGILLPKLSHGQRKKALLAFSLACNAEVTILDEPTNGLDIPSKGQFRRVLAQEATEQRTFILSTHQVKDVENLIDSVVIVDEGKLLFSENMYRVGTRLAQSFSSSEPTEGSALYTEQTVGGFVSLRESEQDEESQIDMELLFNAITNRPEKVSAVFSIPGGER
jgi:ABC-2 type transport system ATP-binding protein